MTRPLLSVRGVAKKYCRDSRRDRCYAIRDIAGEVGARRAASSLRPGEFWALQDVSLDVAAGESVAILGHNGAGKSTLLKLLDGLLKPDAGEIRLHGRAEAVIELGAGLNPSLTARENIELAAALRGLDPRRLRELVAMAEDFAELQGFVDALVQSFSSGMRARLAFALIIGLRPDLLLVDEVLAVGDVEFQRKCVTHLRGYLASGGSLLLVTHNTYQAQAVCDRAILLEEGRVAYSGAIADTVSRLYQQRAPHSAGADFASAADRGPATIVELSAEPAHGEEIRSGEAVRMRLRCRANEPLEAVWGFSIWTYDQWVCVTGATCTQPVRLREGETELSCSIPNLPLLPGLYYVRASLNDSRTHLFLGGCGWNDPGLLLEVRAPPDRFTNAQVRLGQLVQLAVEWDPR